VVSGVVVHILIVYVTVELVSKSSTLCTMLHGSIELVLLGNGVVVVDNGDVDNEVALRKSITFTQKSFVPAAATDALHTSRDAMRMLTIRKTGFSAVRTYAMCQSFIFLLITFSTISILYTVSRKKWPS